MQTTSVNVMLDLETMGTGADARIIQCALVPFEPLDPGSIQAHAALNKYIGPDRFYRNSSFDMSTVAFWMQQESSAAVSLRIMGTEAVSAATLVRMLINFPMQFGIEWKDITIWADPINFDLPILASLFRSASIGEPWNYRNTVDARTIHKLASPDQEYIKPNVDWIGCEPHNALHDAVGQCLQVQMSLRAIEGNPLPERLQNSYSVVDYLPAN